MTGWLARLQTRWAWSRTSRWRVVLQYAIIALSFGFMLNALVSNASALDLASLRFDVPAFIMAILLTCGAVWLGALAWAVMVQTLYPEVHLLALVRQHLNSLSVKYLPGWGWQQVSKAVQLRREGMSTVSSGMMAGMDLGLVTISGIVASLQVLALGQFGVPGLYLSTNGRLLLLGVAWSLFVCVPIIIVFSMPLVGFYRSRRIRTLIKLWLVELIQILGWIIFGLGFWFTCNIIIKLSPEAIASSIFALITSVIIGMLVIFVPNGIGVRELVMSVLIQSVVPPPFSVMCSIMSRIILLIAEFICFMSILSPRILAKLVRSI